MRGPAAEPDVPPARGASGGGHRGVVAAGHPLTAEVGAAVLADGGNAVDAALAAMACSFVAEPLLTGLGAGGYMLVALPGEAPVLLDFFAEAPGRGRHGSGTPRSPLVPVDVHFGGAVQVYNAGAASCAVYGTPAGVCEAARRFGTRPLSELLAPAVAHARRGVALNRQQAYLFDLLAPILATTPEASARYLRDGATPREGDVLADPELGDALERLGVEGEGDFYRGETAARVAAWLEARGGAVGAADLASYAPVARAPMAVIYHGRTVLTNPPPSAGGILIAYALAQLEAAGRRPSLSDLVRVMERAQAERTEDFLAGLAEPGYGERFLATRLGSTTHIAILDARGGACSVTCTNGEGSGQIVPGTGIHLSNMMGESDLSPLGFFTHPPGRRLPSMMAPTLVLRDGIPELALGSAGSNRIRSAILQVVVGVIDHGLDLAAAVDAPRVHFEDGLVYAEPGADVASLEAEGRTLVAFGERHLFFGGVQAARRDPASGELTGAGDPRRGGVAVAV